MFATKLRLSQLSASLANQNKYLFWRTRNASSVDKKINWIDTLGEVNGETQTFVVQSPDVIVHLVQELRVQQVHSSKQHLRGQASC